MNVRERMFEEAANFFHLILCYWISAKEDLIFLLQLCFVFQLMRKLESKFRVENRDTDLITVGILLSELDWTLE